MAAVNNRLRTVLGQRGVSPDALAEICEVDPKTRIQRDLRPAQLDPSVPYVR